MATNGAEDTQTTMTTPRSRHHPTGPRLSQHAPRGSRTADPSKTRAGHGRHGSLPPSFLHCLLISLLLTASGRCGEASSSSFSSTNMAGGPPRGGHGVFRQRGRGEVLRPRACAERRRTAPPAGGAAGRFSGASDRLRGPAEGFPLPRGSGWAAPAPPGAWGSSCCRAWPLSWLSSASILSAWPRCLGCRRTLHPNR